MGAIAPQRRISKTRKRQRRSHFKLENPSMMVCPNCGELILPCALCDHDKCDCANCPLEAIKKDILSKYTKEVD